MTIAGDIAHQKVDDIARELAKGHDSVRYYRHTMGPRDRVIYVVAFSEFVSRAAVLTEDMLFGWSTDDCVAELTKQIQFPTKKGRR